MGTLEKIYDLAPISFQSVMISISGYIRNRNRYGKTYREYLAFLRNFDRWSLSEKLKYQEEELVKFVRFAYENSRFYRALYKDIDMNSFKGLSDLRKLPIVDKEMIRSGIDDVTTIARKGAIEGHTGGTTGKSLITLRTPADMMERMAVLDHFKERVGFVHFKMKRATFNGKHIIPPNQKSKKFWRYNAACKQMIYSSFHLSEENLLHYVDSLNQFKPQAIDGFFSSICDIAGFIERHAIKLQFTPLAIFPTSETLTKSGRELLERVFKCKVYDQYASSEGAPFVTECNKQTLHIELATGVFEHLGDSNEILVTSFTTHGTPLIRYRIGDQMIFKPDTSICGCGNASPLVEEILGRSLDFLYTPEGAKINAGNVSNLFKNLPNAIIKAQLIQDRMNEIKILLAVDKQKYQPDYDDLILTECAHKFGSNMAVKLIHVDEIPHEANGKYQMIKNNIHPINDERMI